MRLILFLWLGLTAAFSKGGAQTVAVEVALSPHFRLCFLPRPAGQGNLSLTGSEPFPLQWLEIDADENIEVMVIIDHLSEDCGAVYVNSGRLETSTTLPFENNRSLFLLNALPGEGINDSPYKAWVGIPSGEPCRITVVYP